MPVPLGVLDLVPVSSGGTAAQALTNSRDLVRRAEAAGYHRYWFAEHHLNPGVVGSSPALTIALTAGDTTRIRLGSGAVLAGHRTALSIAEEFALLAAAFPGRIDLGLGRSGLRRAPGADKPTGLPPRPAAQEYTTPEGLLVPAPVALGPLLSGPRFRASQSLLYLKGAQPEGYAEIVTTIQDILGGTLEVGELSLDRAAADTPSDPELWILGSSKGESAALAGQRALPFGANYHVAPSGVIDAVGHYRDSFVPGDRLTAPHVTVSADVVVAPTDDEAEYLAAGYGQWVASIRTGRGAIPYPTPEEAAADPLPPEEEALVDDRLRTRFVGSPERVADQLGVLQAATGADELLITTITHDHEARARSHELLAAAWFARP
ncbi:LLM class flavin-dependent oxidoreductase [Ornithinicoccus hortensis]|uniref:Luciferase family oxidoreductase group 1 n=1 Tax=Ornithinicoccus hortensis TaxID=82346 RepID=A0A542YMI5_9MICO|nr:LLM class flavin-dependent oxidoreductase [Ornithinicoccus hortensis]TQL49299.1 luciferase family oxidoreductase group 1 [Ornithinicoccus hortensis]